VTSRRVVFPSGGGRIFVLPTFSLSPLNIFFLALFF